MLNKQVVGHVIIMMNNLCLECKTVSGDLCMFPFYWNGTQHHECIITNGRPRCRIDTSVNWYKCRPDCPGNLLFGDCFDYMMMTNYVLVESECVFPFYWKGVWHNECQKHPDAMDKTWCPISVNEKGRHTNWNYCEEEV